MSLLIYFFTDLHVRYMFPLSKMRFFQIHIAFLYYRNIKLSSEMAQQIRTLAAKSNDLSWIPGWDPCRKWRELFVL